MITGYFQEKREEGLNGYHCIARVVTAGVKQPFTQVIYYGLMYLYTTLHNIHYAHIDMEWDSLKTIQTGAIPI